MLKFMTVTAKPSRSNQKARAANESIRNNLADYGLESYYCDIMVADASKHAMWRPMEIFDAVITDRMQTIKLLNLVNKEFNTCQVIKYVRTSFGFKHKKLE